MWIQSHANENRIQSNLGRYGIDTSKEERLYNVTQGAGLKSNAFSSTSKDEDNPFLLGDFETQDVCMHSRAFVILKTKHKIHSDSRYLISRAEILYFACALDSIHRIV